MTAADDLAAHTDTRRQGECARCRDADMHAFYTSGRAFRWRRPKFDRMTAAKPGTRLMLNRYPHNVIGAALYIRGRGFGIRWKG